MKFLTFTMYDVAKTADVAQASDRAWSSRPDGIELLANYVCLSSVFPNQPPNTLVSIAITEAESAEAIAAVSYPIALAGATITRVPLLDITPGAAAEAEKKYRG